METKELIRDYIRRELVMDRKHAAVSDSDQLVDSGIIDSLGIMKLVTFMEDQLAVKVSDQDLVPENFATLDAIAAMVARKSH